MPMRGTQARIHFPYRESHLIWKPVFWQWSGIMREGLVASTIDGQKSHRCTARARENVTALYV